MTENVSDSKTYTKYFYEDASPETVGRLWAIPKDLLLRAPSLENSGFFCLMKSSLIVEGVNRPESGRCDNLSYGLTGWTSEQENKGNGLSFGEKIPYTDEVFGPQHLKRVLTFSEVPSVFGFAFFEFKNPELERGPWRATLTQGRTMGELLRIMYEWSLLAEEPFNSEHVYAVSCKKVLALLNPPENIINEIKSYPDMHLVRFLRGEESHRELVEDFPEMSIAMKEWVVSVVEDNPKLPFDEILNKI
jgi:hypothetical protein